MDEKKRSELQQRRQELLNMQSGVEGAESRRQDAEDRVTMAAKAINTPGFPRPLPADIEAAERELEDATEACDRIHLELKEIDVELGIL